MQNMTRPEALVSALGGNVLHYSNPVFVLSRNTVSPSVPSNYKSLIHHININTLPDLVIFIHTLPSYLDAHPNVTLRTTPLLFSKLTFLQTRLLVLNSISFPFQFPNLNPHNKTSLLDRIKQTLAKACAVRSLTVINSFLF